MGFITNNSFLSGRTHRRMRQSLFESFDEIYIINLHGGKNEKDQNVFDIQVGTCISLFVKTSKANINARKVFYYSTLDNDIISRADKFAFLNELSHKGLKSVKWQELKLESPYFWFVPKRFENEEYEEFWALAQNKAMKKDKTIFKEINSGSSSIRDKICIHMHAANLNSVLDDFLTLEVEAIKNKYQIEDARDWSVERAKQDIENNKKSLQDKIYKIAYRPFDERITFFSGKSKGFWGVPAVISKHFTRQEKNLGLCFPKTCLNANFDYGLVINSLADRALGGKNTGSETCIAPLYLYDDENLFDKVPNFTPEFMDYKNKHKVLKDKSPKQILAFIYANLFSLAYRQKYLEYLKIGFARINFEVDKKRFEKLEKLGSKLIDLHLFKTIPQNDTIKLHFSSKANKVNPSFVLEKLSENKRFDKNKIIINKDLELTGIDEAVWTYTIGGYQVLKQWLKYRNELELNKEELEYFANMAKIIQATLELQAQIDIP